MAVETDADLLIFLSADEFGQPGIYTPAGGAAIALFGILDRPSMGSAINDVMTLDSRPTFCCRASDIPDGDGAGGKLEVAGTSYAVASVEPDGQGLALIRLAAL